MTDLASPRFLALAAVAALGCGGSDGSDGQASYGDDPADQQLPARGSTDALDWLEAGFYLDWQCEPEPHAARALSPHGTNRVCNNDALRDAAGSGSFPIGAASVKELYDGDDIRLFALYRKVSSGEGGDTWYWYEGSRGDTAANGEGEGVCVGCHSRAPRDYVFTIVP